MVYANHRNIFTKVSTSALVDYIIRSIVTSIMLRSIVTSIMFNQKS